MNTTKWGWKFGLLAWIDVETTGLYRPGQPLPRLLEVALLVTDPQLEVVTQCSVVISAAQPDLADMNPVAEVMHTENGLLAECCGPRAVSIPAAEMIMITTLEEARRATPEYADVPVVWCGWSPSALDRPMLGVHMPAFYKLIHYRTYDLSAVKLGLINHTGLTFPEKTEVHRAHADNVEAVAEARRIRSYLRLHCGEAAPIEPAVLSAQ